MTNNLNKNALDGFLEFAKEANTRSTLAVEDGLKPVHRRILFGMAEDKIWATGQHTGSAKIVGSILGNYHPHGDASVYDAAVRLSQDFKLRYPLINFYGNNGSILDPDSYAASRYTKMKLSPLGQLMLEDIQKNTVDMVENYNGELLEPVVLPSMIPNAILNGGMGIGVGISSSLVPHNLAEVVDGINAYINNPKITTEELMHHIQGPDFPTGGIITDSFKLPEIYESGKGTVTLRSKYRIEQANGRPVIVITETPYLINIENRIIGPIQQMVTEENYDKIYDVQNASGKNGFELHIILEKDANPNAVLQTLFERTGLQTTIKINNTVMMADGSFITLGMRGLITHYLKHQHNILIRKYKWELEKAEDRLHIVDGLIIAVENIDEVVKIIKGSKSTAEAKTNLIKAFKLSELQSAAILDMRLARLTSLEINKLQAEKKELLAKITEFKSIIASEKKREEIISKFLRDLKKNYADSRRTKISEMSIIEKGEHVYITIDEANTISYISKDELHGMARKKIASKAPVCAIECNTKDSVALLDIKGKCYVATGREIIDGKVSFDAAIMQILPYEEKDYMLFVTEQGIIKKTPSIKIKKSSQVTKIRDEDKPIAMFFANDEDYVMVLGTEGKVINLAVADIPGIGRLTYGSKGITTDKVLAATLAKSVDLILTVSSDNKAKLTKHEDFIVNTKGSTGQVTTEDCINIKSVHNATSLVLFGTDSKVGVINVNSLAIKGKTAAGAKVFSSKLASVVCV